MRQCRQRLKIFEIATLTKFANQDSLMLSGVINGNALVKDITTSPLFYFRHYYKRPYLPA